MTIETSCEAGIIHFPYTTQEDAVAYYNGIADEFMRDAADRLRLAVNLEQGHQTLRENGIMDQPSDHAARVHFSRTGSNLVGAALHFRRVADEFRSGKRRVNP